MHNGAPLFSGRPCMLPLTVEDIRRICLDVFPGVTVHTTETSTMGTCTFSIWRFQVTLTLTIKPLLLVEKEGMVHAVLSFRYDATTPIIPLKKESLESDPQVRGFLYQLHKYVNGVACAIVMADEPPLYFWGEGADRN